MAKPHQPDPNDLAFEQFWSAYPLKRARQSARIAFLAAITKTSIEVMLAALAWQVQSRDWTINGGIRIPFPATWLNQERWTDEAPKRTRAQRSSDASRNVRLLMDTGLSREEAIAAVESGG